MLFISIRSDTAAQVPKVLQVVEETKRKRHKAGRCTLISSDHGIDYGAGVAFDQELYQYVVYDTQPEPSKGPRVIKLDGPSKGKGKDAYAPPESLTVHLSKISMPELEPKVDPSIAKTETSKPQDRHQASGPVVSPDDKAGKGKFKFGHTSQCFLY
jgi:hypothetical protein